MTGKKKVRKGQYGQRSSSGASDRVEKKSRRNGSVASVHDRDAADVLGVTSVSSLSIHQTATTSPPTLSLDAESALISGLGKSEGTWYQKSPISSRNRENGVGPARIVSREFVMFPERVRPDGSTDSVAPGAETLDSKRKRLGEDEDDAACRTLEEKQKVSGESRVWDYIRKRSVMVSPPPPRACDSENPASPTPTSNKFSALASVSGKQGRGCPPENGSLQVKEVDPGVRLTSSGSKTSFTHVTVNGNIVKVTVTKEARVIETWIKKRHETCFGLDVEWQPNRLKGQQANKVALLQISSETDCLLVQMLYLDSIPDALVDFLGDPEIKITGVGIHGDSKKLERDYGLECAGEIELTTLAVDILKSNEFKRVGLKALAKRLLGFDINKSKRVTMSNWSKSHLDRNQIEYGCMDAWVSHALFWELRKHIVIVA